MKKALLWYIAGTQSWSWKHLVHGWVGVGGIFLYLGGIFVLLGSGQFDHLFFIFLALFNLYPVLRCKLGMDARKMEPDKVIRRFGWALLIIGVPLGTISYTVVHNIAIVPVGWLCLRMIEQGAALQLEPWPPNRPRKRRKLKVKVRLPKFSWLPLPTPLPVPIISSPSNTDRVY